jgi:NAD(P)-dependent dehydrogenase (short-subunit alcohol dehydrogenase family)
MARSLLTGATGFIGRHLAERLLARGETVYALVRESSRGRLDALRGSWDGGERVVPLVGDLEAPLLGVAHESLEELRGSLDHVFHLAALYDMSASAHRLEAANVRGTWHAVQLANAVGAGCFHHVSSIAAAGRTPGVFREDMFEQATGLDDPYFRTKHASERVVRAECRVPWRIYRPGVVVGDSRTGEMDKLDGPYYFFGLLRRLAAALPGRLPLLAVDTGAQLNLVPVDFVARALDHIAHRQGLDGRTFHLVDPQPRSVVDTLNLFACIAGGPRFARRVGPALGAPLARLLRGPVGALPLRIVGAALNSRFGIPPRLLRSLDWPTRFDCQETQAALAGSGIEVPPLESYARLLWEYWENELDADLRFSPALARAVRGRRVLVTGASAGIGRAAALKLGAAGARVLLVARNAARLERIRDHIERAGGEAHAYPTDLSSVEACELLIKRVLCEHGGVDVLVNNAGRSIRRSLDLAYERFHDYERTMQLNYFGALKLTLGFLPGMRERRDGHVVNVSSLGVQTGEARFSAYVASKAALDAFSRSASGELFGDGVSITTVYMPLVRTAMSRPTALYDLMPELTPAQAAEWICRAIVERPSRIALPGALLAEAAHLAAPRLVDGWMSVLYRLSQPGASAASLREATTGALRELARRLPAPLRRRAAPPTQPPAGGEAPRPAAPRSPTRRPSPGREGPAARPSRS